MFWRTSFVGTLIYSMYADSLKPDRLEKSCAPQFLSSPLVHRNHPGIMGDSGANLPHIFAIIAEAVMQETLDAKSDVYMRLLNIVRQVQVKSIANAIRINN